MVVRLAGMSERSGGGTPPDPPTPKAPEAAPPAVVVSPPSKMSLAKLVLGLRPGARVGPGLEDAEGEEGARTARFATMVRRYLTDKQHMNGVEAAGQDTFLHQLNYAVETEEDNAEYKVWIV